VLSTPLMETSPRFVSRVYPARGGAGGSCSRGWGFVENNRPRLKQRVHIDCVDVPGRSMAMIVGNTRRLDVVES
jgi:hypothetical protein